MDDLDMYEEPEFDAETQERLDSQVSDHVISQCCHNLTNVSSCPQVDKLLKGYDWTLAPLANRYLVEIFIEIPDMMKNDLY